MQMLVQEQHEQTQRQDQLPHVASKQDEQEVGQRWASGWNVGAAAAASSTHGPYQGDDTSHEHERWRRGMGGGRARWGNSGGSNREYYSGYYRAKGVGRAAVAEYIRIHGAPPSKGGGAFHDRKSE